MNFYIEENKMQKLKFYNNETLRKLARETFYNIDFRKPYTEEITREKGFWLVKDHGIYLMQGFLENKNNPKNIVSYANGYNPNQNTLDELWNKCHDFSSDDFGEWIPITDDSLFEIEQKKANFEIKLTETTIETIIIKRLKNAS
tara:strand:+ start:390 stop:821 length:432 start_codon:yes stop_codon:yes gene_type:complete